MHLVLKQNYFFLKLKGDYHRYKCEFASDKDFDDSCNKTEKVYKEAYEIANKEIPITNSTRLGLVRIILCFIMKLRD